MTRIAQSFLDRLLEAVNLSDLIRQTIPLTRQGQGLHAGACPFHSRAASGTLVVDDSTQRFSCEYCEFGGSAIGWLMYHDGHSFRSAISELSREAELDSSVWIDADDLAAELIDHIELLDEVAQHYHQQLMASSEALQYLALRGLSLESAKAFGIGYAPADPHALGLIDAFARRERDLWRAGLVVRRTNRSYYPRFRNRLMFPIRDALNCTVGFGGRDIIGRSPKYLNSPTSALFQKGRTLYGLEKIRVERSMPLVIVEGYLDVIALHQARFERVVAPLGTAMTLDHLMAAFERSDELVLCFDADSAGQGSAVRTLTLAHNIMQRHQTISVVQLPQPDVDPDKLIQKTGGEVLMQQAIACRTNGAKFLVEYHARGVDLSSIGESARLAHQLAPVIEQSACAAHRLQLVDELESLIGVRVV